MPVPTSGNRCISVFVVSGLAAILGLCGAITTTPSYAVQSTEQQAAEAISVAGHRYNELPYNNSTVSKVDIDNSSLPSYLRNPIGQNEGKGSDSLDENYYSADAAAMEYDNKLFVFTGHDEAALDYGSFNMKDWGVYVTDNPESGKWTHYKNVAQADLFSWATGDGAYAGQVVVDDGGTEDTSDDWFYYYIPVKDKNAASGADPFSIGVAKSKSPLGPWVDAIGSPLLTTSQTEIETIDPAFFVDSDGTGYLHFGTFNSQLAVRMARDGSGRTSYTEVEKSKSGEPNIYNMRDADAVAGNTNYDPSRDIKGSAYAKSLRIDTGANGGSYANGPKGFFEAAWVFKKGDTYYNVYDGGKPGSGIATCVESNYQACIQYSTSSSPLGPWKYQGVIVPSGSSTTMHPSVLKFNNKWWITYHTGDKEGGTDFRRAVSIDEVNWTTDNKMTATAHPTKSERIQPSRNVAPYATVNATFTEGSSWRRAVNDGRVLQTAVVPPNHWTNYRKMPQSQFSDSLIYQWQGTIHTNSAKVWFDVDSNALKAPASWKLQYLTQDGIWRDVTGIDSYGTGTGKNNPNTVHFDTVTTTALKLDIRGQSVDGGYASVAVSEWEVYSAGEVMLASDSAEVTTKTGVAPILPKTVKVKVGEEVADTPVLWRTIDPLQYAKVGEFTVQGVVSGMAAKQDVNDLASGNARVKVKVQNDYAAPADTTKPIVNLSIAGTIGENGWIAVNPMAVVSANDDGDIAKLEIKIGNGEWKTIASGAAAAIETFSAEGDITVQARATDGAGNMSKVASAVAKIDAEGPKVVSFVDKSKRTMTLAASDSGSGLASIEYRIGDGDWIAYHEGDVISAAETTRIVVHYRAVDKAGNILQGSTIIPADLSVPLTGYIEREAVSITDVDGKASSWTQGVAALNDGVIIPDGCTNENACIWGSWPNTGEMRLDYEWDREVAIDSSRVQFTSDGGGLGIPSSWKLQYWDAEQSAFVDIPQAMYTISSNVPGSFGADESKGWSKATWPTEVKTTKLRMVIISGGASPAVAEWQVHAPESEGSKPAVDKSALKDAIDVADKLSEASYTTDSWKAFAEALANAHAVYAQADATQDAVNDARAALTGAQDALILKSDIVLVTGVTLTPASLTMSVGDMPQAITATVTPENATNKNVMWHSSDTRVATVSDDGKITAVAEGMATITVTAEEGGFTAAVEVAVRAAQTSTPIGSVSITDENNKVLDGMVINAKVGQRLMFKARLIGYDAAKWSVADTTVATVDDRGEVVAVGTGKTTLTLAGEKAGEVGSAATLTLRVIDTGDDNNQRDTSNRTDDKSDGLSSTGVSVTGAAAIAIASTGLGIVLIRIRRRDSHD